MTDVVTPPDGSGTTPTPDEIVVPDGATPPVVETPPDGATPPAAGTVLTDGDVPQGAPETYADFTVPEGMTVDTGLLDSISPIMKEIGLSQIQGQQMVDVYSAAKQAESKANSDAYDQTQTEWQTTAKSDPEIGGELFDKNVAEGKRALDKFGSPGLVKVLNDTGLGNHPEVLRLFTRVSKLIVEDDPGGSQIPTGEKLDHAAIMYPDEKKTA